MGALGGERGTAADRAETQRALEGDDDLPTDWARRNHEDDAEENDEFYDFEGEEGDLTSTLAIIALCLLLAYVLSPANDDVAHGETHLDGCSISVSVVYLRSRSKLELHSHEQLCRSRQLGRQMDNFEL